MMQNKNSQCIAEIDTYNRKDHYEIAEMGVRLYDYIKIVPAMGNTRHLKLNRTNIQIDLLKQFIGEISPARMVLPALGLNEKSFSLHLVFPNATKKDEEGRYLVRALSQRPFRLNGKYVFKAFLERGDILELGFNRLTFSRQLQEDLQGSEHTHDILKHRKILYSKLPILLEGETGTGKSSFAKKLHNESGRSGEFVQLNLASFSSGLLESELFGHAKGAFTGAIFEKRGAVLEANKGTLFLDEIDSLPLDIQTKLLLFLDSKEFRCVGGSFNKSADVRFIFATGRPLEQLVDDGEMRRDFYYRLNSGAKLRLDKLRENRKLIDAYCRRFSIEHNCQISNELMKLYMNLPWHGNYRQLKGHLEKKLLHANGNNLQFDQLDDELKETPKIILNTEEFLSLEQMKQNYAKKAFQYFNKNITKTAEVLAVTKTTCRKLVKS